MEFHIEQEPKADVKIKDIYIYLLIALLVILVGASLLAPVIYPINLGATDLNNRLADPQFINPESPHIFGTDQLGRDLFVRLFYAVNTTVYISFTGMIFALLTGATLGIIAGLAGGKIDSVISFITDSMLSIPTTFIGIILAVILGAKPLTTIIVIAISGWASFCRLVRSQILQLKNATFIEVSRTIGAGNIRIIFEHILPNIASPLIVQATSSLSGFILLESTLSFIGLGIQPPGTSLGVMISEGRDFMLTHWWLAIIPSITMIILILLISLIGDWLRDKLDPKMKYK